MSDIQPPLLFPRLGEASDDGRPPTSIYDRPCSVPRMATRGVPGALDACQRPWGMATIVVDGQAGPHTRAPAASQSLRSHGGVAGSRGGGETWEDRRTGDGLFIGRSSPRMLRRKGGLEGLSCTDPRLASSPEPSVAATDGPPTGSAVETHRLPALQTTGHQGQADR